MHFIILVLLCINLPYLAIILCESNTTSKIKDFSTKGSATLPPTISRLREEKSASTTPIYQPKSPDRQKVKPKSDSRFPNTSLAISTDVTPIKSDTTTAIPRPPFPPLKPQLKPLKCDAKKSCAGRCSFKREFLNPGSPISTCFCDAYCNSVFNDCCADYDIECNATFMKENVKESELDGRLDCFSVDIYDVWMIGSCAPGWKEDEISKRCTSPKLFRSISNKIPVIDRNNITYRNRYCALCNGMAQFTSWNFTVACDVAPPQGYSENEWVRFLDYFCRSDSIVFRSNTKALRYCYHIISTCKFRRSLAYVTHCETGPTGLVAFESKNFRNLGCFYCSIRERYPLCGPVLYAKAAGKLPVPFSTIFTGTAYSGSSQFSHSSSSSINNPITHQPLTSGEVLQKYCITLTYEPQEDDNCHLSKVARSAEINTWRFSYVLEKLLDVSLPERGWQLADLNTHIQGNSSYIVTFYVLGLWNNVQANSAPPPLQYSKIDNLVFRSIFLNGACRYFLADVVVRKMVCIENSTYDGISAANANGFPENKTIYVKETQQYYFDGEYLLYEQDNETRLAVCKNFRPANCSHYLRASNTTQWKSFPNGTIYSHVTNTWYQYGEYSIVDGTLWLCETKTSRAKTHVLPDIPASVHHQVLSYTTLVTMSISIVSLVVLLAVYFAFSPLRNLPGKNLMLLCGTLALGQLLWLLQHLSWFGSSHTGCIAMVILIQYFFLSSFCCSGSIAFHSFLTFRSVAKGNFRQSTEANTFLWCLAYSLGFPLALVVIAWLLIYFEIIAFHYGESFCWFANKTSLYIAFIGPILALLSFNFLLLLATLRMIHECTRDTRKLAEKNGGPDKKHVGIYLRMSTIMGLTWLFGLFQIGFPEELVFHYLFAITNGLQGFYIAVAFLLTDNVRKILSSKLAKGSSTQRTDTF